MFPAKRAVPSLEAYPACPDGQECTFRLVRERGDTLNGVDFGCNERENGRLVTRSGADLEHAVILLDTERLDHESDRIGL